MEELDFTDKPIQFSITRMSVNERGSLPEETITPRRHRPVRFRDIEQRLDELRLQREISEVYDR